MNKSRGLAVLLALSLLWTLSMFAAPATLPSGAVRGLDGHANLIDYGEKWNSLPLYPRVIYYFGDLWCHQDESRSFLINSNQMPVCARDVSIFIFVNLGLLTAFFAQPSPSIISSFMSIFPKRAQGFIEGKIGRILFFLLIIVLCILPTAADGFYQLLTPYESTNPARVITGAPLGWIGGFFVGVVALVLGHTDKKE